MGFQRPVFFRIRVSENPYSRIFCAVLLELSHISKDLVRIASLRCKSHVKVRLKHMISYKRIIKKFFQL